MRVYNFTLWLAACITVLASCSKPPVTVRTDTTPPPTSPTQPPAQPNTNPFTVDNKWECDINGIPYRGTVDTSFVVISGNDTIVSCIGTSSDKKAHVYFWVAINRRSFGNFFSTQKNGGTFAFDTSTSSVYKAVSGNSAEIVYQVDTLADGKMRANFSGTLFENNLLETQALRVTNGKFSCEFGKGNHEPVFFSFQRDVSLVNGYIRSASLISNTLVVEGQVFDSDVSTKFKLMVRTGGAIRPGIYKSGNGDAGLQYNVRSYPSIYITDDYGSLSVTILSVSGNVVEASFTGTNADGKSVANGKFSCRVKDYLPQQDLPDNWRFNFDESSFYLYTLYGGNILNAGRTQANGRYFITVNGESDNGNSTFKLVISSASSIVPGVYKTGYTSNHLDSLYFRSNQKLWNGNTTYLYADYYSDTYIRIDTVDAKKIVGALQGNIRVFFSSSGSSGSDIRKGSFRASF